MGVKATEAASMGGRANTPDVDALVASFGGDRLQLGPLGLTPLTAVHAVAWSGTLSNRLSGSVITATSDDSTALTVSGDGVSGTFSAAGTKTLTLTETLAGAAGSPLVTTKTLVAS